jgi:hypothetical protein
MLSIDKDMIVVDKYGGGEWMDNEQYSMMNGVWRIPTFSTISKKYV